MAPAPRHHLITDGSAPAADEEARATQSPRRRRVPAAVLACAGAACLVAGGAVLVLDRQAPGPPEVGALPAAVSAAPGPAPTQVIVAGVVPVELALPAAGVLAPVVAVGTDPDGALLVPEPPSTVGWWSPSALAGGSGGTTVLAGHVDSAAAGIGALAALRVVEVGAEVVLRGADGRAVDYRVQARRQYAKAELPPEVFATGGPPRLVLITCGGRFDPATRHYEDNVVVFAEPVR